MAEFSRLKTMSTKQLWKELEGHVGTPYPKLWSDYMEAIIAELKARYSVTS